jgi:leader peptidase (prepilin peptidase) / N-methyltransferase
VSLTSSRTPEPVALPRDEPAKPGPVVGAGKLSRAQQTAAIGAGVALVALTFVVVHPLANAALYALVQVLLVAVAAVDLATRRIPNELVAALAAVAVAARAIAERSALAESITAGVAVFAIALLLASIARGGLGMGDVKLAAALGFVLGKVVVVALLLGTIAGAIAAVAILVRQGKAGRRTTFAYGPYLVLGAAVAVLLFGPPPLV